MTEAEQTRDFLRKSGFRKRVIYAQDIRDMVYAHPYYEVAYMMHGTAVWEIEGLQVQQDMSEVVLMPPGMPHRLWFRSSTDRQEPHLLVLHIAPEMLEYLDRYFEGESLQGCFAPRNGRYVLPLDYKQRLDLGRLMQSIRDDVEPERDLPGHRIVCANLVSIMLVKLWQIDFDVRSRLKGSENANLALSAKAFIDSNCTLPITVDKLAEMLFVSKSHLLHAFKKQTGTSVYHYLTERRLAHACELLCSGEAPKWVYLHCGFRDYSNFYRAFCNKYGCSPQQYAADHKKEM